MKRLVIVLCALIVSAFLIAADSTTNQNTNQNIYNFTTDDGYEIESKVGFIIKFKFNGKRPDQAYIDKLIKPFLANEEGTFFLPINIFVYYEGVDGKVEKLYELKDFLPPQFQSQPKHDIPERQNGDSSRIKIENIKTKIIEDDGDFATISWKAEITNLEGQEHKYNVEIKYLDAEEMELAGDSEIVKINAGETFLVTGRSYVKSIHANNSQSFIVTAQALPW